MKRSLILSIILLVVILIFATGCNSVNLFGTERESGSEVVSSKTEQNDKKTDTDEDINKESEAKDQLDTKEDQKDDVFETYSRVVILGVDGAGAFFKDTFTPNVDRIFSNYATSYNVLTAYPTISAQCWASMLMGVEPEVHRLTNDIITNRQYDVESPYPSIFRVLHEANPDAVLASFCNWQAINNGIIESNLGVIEETGSSDFEVCTKICDYLDNNSPNLLYVQFDSVDGAGHKYGFGSETHLTTLTTIDGYIGAIYQKLEEKGLLEDTLFIVTADHGGTPKGNHGGSTDAERYVFMGVAGKTVEKGRITEAETRDVAAICATALGLSIPDTWTGRLPKGIFKGIGGGKHKETVIYVSPNRTHATEETPTVSTVESLLEDYDAIAYLPFDGSAENSIGQTTTTANGKIYYSDGYYGDCISLDDGYITLNDVTIGNDSFSVACWIKTNGVTGEPCIISNKDWENGYNNGFAFAFREEDIKFNAGYRSEKSSRMDSTAVLPLDYQEGWMHVILTVNRTENVVKIYIDFKLQATEDISTALQGVSFDALTLNIGQDGTGELGSHLSAQLDEFILLGNALTLDDISTLKNYYIPQE